MDTNTHEQRSRGARRPVDITTVSNEAANAWLCGWDLTVYTAAGRIEPTPTGMALVLEGKRRPRHFETAKSALGVLRRAAR